MGLYHSSLVSDAHPAWAVHDLERLRANLSELRRRIGPDQALIAALKANAYGHGAMAVAAALDGEGLAAYMTGSYDEAKEMKAAGLRTPVVMFAGALPSGMADLIGAGLTPTVVDMAGAEAAAKAAPPGGAAEIYASRAAGSSQCRYVSIRLAQLNAFSGLAFSKTGDTAA